MTLELGEGDKPPADPGDLLRLHESGKTWLGLNGTHYPLPEEMPESIRRHEDGLKIYEGSAQLPDRLGFSIPGAAIVAIAPNAAATFDIRAGDSLTLEYELPAHEDELEDTTIPIGDELIVRVLKRVEPEATHVPGIEQDGYHIYSGEGESFRDLQQSYVPKIFYEETATEHTGYLREVYRYFPLSEAQEQAVFTVGNWPEIPGSGDMGDIDQEMSAAITEIVAKLDELKIVVDELPPLQRYTQIETRDLLGPTGQTYIIPEGSEEIELHSAPTPFVPTRVFEGLRLRGVSRRQGTIFRKFVECDLGSVQPGDKLVLKDSGGKKRVSDPVAAIDKVVPFHR